MTHPHWQSRANITHLHDVVAPEAALLPGEGEVLMNFPRQVILTTQEGQRVFFAPGPRKVPARLADHPYLAANGATLVDVPDPEPESRGRRGR